MQDDASAWLAVTDVTPNHFVVTASSSSLCPSNTAYSPLSLTGEVTAFAAVSGWSAPYITTIPVAITVTTPVLEVFPLQLSHVFTSRLSTGQSAVVTITNSGNVPLMVSECVVDAASQFLAITVHSTLPLVVPPLRSAVLALTVEVQGAPSGEYEATLTLVSNQRSCSSPSTPGANNVSVSIPWSVRVLDVLFFPSAGDATLPLSPDFEPPPLTLSLANFGGDAIRCVFSLLRACDAFVNVSHVQPSSQLAAGELWSFPIQCMYPVATTAATVACAITAACDRTSDGTSLPSQTVTIVGKRVIGAPHANSSTVNITLPAIVRAGSTVSVAVRARDRAGNSITEPDVLSAAVTVNVRSWGLDVSLPLLQAAVSQSGEFEFNVTIPVTGLGGATHSAIVVSVSGEAPPGASAPLLLSNVTCPRGMVPDAAAATCVCDFGHYTNSSLAACVPCRAGTFQPITGNVSSTRCLACSNGWYCDAGSRLPSAECPPLGFDCSTGTLRVRAGYWINSSGLHFDGVSLVLSASESTGSANISATKCTIPEACPGGEGACALGYSGQRCARCQSAFASLQHRCFRQLPAVVSVLWMLLWILAVALSVALQVSVSYEERSVQRQRQMWVITQGALLCSELQLLSDGLQVMALQVLMPSQLPMQFFQGALWVTGAALGPGTWPPTVQLFTSRWSGLWLPAYALLGTVLLAVAASLLLATSVWKRKPQRPLNIGKRAAVATRLLLWFVFPSVLWALAASSVRVWAVVAVG